VSQEASAGSRDQRVAELLEAARRALPYINDIAVQMRLRSAIDAVAAVPPAPAAAPQPAAAAPAAPAPAAPVPPPAPAPTPAAPQSAEAGGDVLAWDLAADDMEIAVSHPSRFRPGQTIAIGEGPTQERVRIRSIMGSRLLGVRGVDGTEIRDHQKGRRISVVG